LAHSKVPRILQPEQWCGATIASKLSSIVIFTFGCLPWLIMSTVLVIL
jgi:hypothetical protein